MPSLACQRMEVLSGEHNVKVETRKIANLRAAFFRYFFWRSKKSNSRHNHKKLLEPQPVQARKFKQFFKK
jgi:hypothetical protein